MATPPRTSSRSSPIDMTSVLLTLIYPLLLLTRVVNAMRGHDPLTRQRPAPGSLWVPRRHDADDLTYFSETSPHERDEGFGAARRALIWLSRWCAPPRQQPREKFSAAADREEGIPDEMYTLW